MLKKFYNIKFKSVLKLLNFLRTEQFIVDNIVSIILAIIIFKKDSKRTSRLAKRQAKINYKVLILFNILLFNI